MRDPNSPWNPRITVKERNLLKGALRRVFSRSELRRAAIERQLIEHSDPRRPRVTKWSYCCVCGEVLPAYTLDVDHMEPLIPVQSKLEEMTLDEVVNRLWCELEQLQVLCKPCHHRKTALENKLRRLAKKAAA